MQEVQETWVWSWVQENPLEKEMAILSSILVGKIPWTEEIDRPQSMGSQKVRHDWAHTHTHTHTHTLHYLPSNVFHKSYPLPLFLGRVLGEFWVRWNKANPWAVPSRRHQDRSKQNPHFFNKFCGTPLIVGTGSRDVGYCEAGGGTWGVNENVTKLSYWDSAAFS